jgi:hypothetical protein
VSIITVRLMGGLGNQLFQYAMGRQLALIHKAKLRYDASAYTAQIPDARQGVRVCGLNHFNVAAMPTSRWESKWYEQYRMCTFIGGAVRHLNRCGPCFGKTYIQEPESQYFTFDSRLLNRAEGKSVYLDGFWQTEKYFKNAAEVIRRDLVVKTLPSTENATLIEAMHTHNSICVHVRHGDNATNTSLELGVLPTAYYEAAASELSHSAATPVFYVFSDDPDWARQNVVFAFPTIYVTHNGDERDYEDLRLMMHCRHHIIGNSTFSWWGAWLGKKHGQIVYAPRNYCVNSQRSNPDYYPESWRLL